MRTKSNIGHSQQYGVITLRRARIRAFLARGRLPPGNLCELDVLERTNRAILLHQHAQHGPIFKVVSYDNFWVCIVGLKLARNFLRTHSESIQPVTVDLEPLVKGGFMRQMKGRYAPQVQTTVGTRPRQREPFKKKNDSCTYILQCPGRICRNPIIFQ